MRTAVLLFVLFAAASQAEMAHVVVAREKGAFFGWPANGGLWTWDEGNEAVVAFISVAYQPQPGHNIGKAHANLVAHTRDGELTWAVEQPQGFAQPGAKFAEPTERLDFSGASFALRCTSIGYHGAEDSRGGFLFSTDRASTWKGPFRFAGLAGCDALKGWEMTCRTDYIASGRDDAIFLMSARIPGKSGTDRTFWARTRDGGLHLEFGGWVVGKADPFRAVMPSSVRLSPASLITAIRRRVLDKETCWLDAYGSDDDVATWRFLSRIGETGIGNGNSTEVNNGEAIMATRNPCSSRLSDADGGGRGTGRERGRQAPRPRSHQRGAARREPRLDARADGGARLGLRLERPDG